MNPILKSLEIVTTGYSVFEKDQVLTHDQLNSVADYGDDQSRLTRTKLLGVGIVCGLRLSMADDVVTVAKGIGVTTDGDLLYLSRDTVFDKFKLYDESNPKYEAFYSGDKMNTVYQLLAQGTAEADAEAKGLGSFATNTGASFDNMVAVLFMEGYVKDQDVCSGTDCDNLGQDFVNTIKLLLVDKGSLGSLQKSVPTPHQAASALSDIVSDRALLNSSIATAAQLATVYRTATNSIEGKLVSELPKLYPTCAALLGDIFTSDPSAGWVAALNSLNTIFTTSDSGIQYYYDFLKDVVETYNELRGLLLMSDPVWCCPELDGFPKHLLLGNLVPGVAAAISPRPRSVALAGLTPRAAADVGESGTIPGSSLSRSAPAAGPVSPVSTAPLIRPVEATPSIGPVIITPPVGPVVSAPPVAPVSTVPLVDPVPTVPAGGPIPIVPPVDPIPTTPPDDPVSIISNEPDENRTGFYPSPIVARSIETLDHFQFLARKLDTLIQTFGAPSLASDIRVTPSTGEESPLEDRAIPYYYQVNTANPIQSAWSYRLHRQGMDVCNYSYNASAYGAQGGAANPLGSQLGRFPFFRIEGHLGQDVAATRTNLEKIITDSNLPFTVQAVFVGVDKTKVVKKPGIVFTDLHRLHQVIRTDLSDHLENAKTFSSYYKLQVNTNLAPTDVDDGDGLKQIKDVAEQKDNALATAADQAQAVLNQRYTSYKANTSWTPAVSSATTSAAEFKQNLNVITTTAFNTPFDSLVSASHANLLNWLDVHIQNKSDKEDEKLLFSKFQATHPGLEHFAGVLRGGTFVLAYDENNKVVADFMLPYYCPEPEKEEDPAEPTLQVPPVKSTTVLTNGIKLGASLDRFVAAKLNTFDTDVVDNKINAQASAIDKTFSLFGSVAGGIVTKSPGTTLGTEVANSYLSAQLTEMGAQQQQLDYLNQKIADPTTADAEREAAQAEVQSKEQDYANTGSAVANILATSKAGEISSTDRDAALNVLASASSKLTTTQARTVAKQGLIQAQGKATDAQTQARFGQIGATFGS